MSAEQKQTSAQDGGAPVPSKPADSVLPAPTDSFNSPYGGVLPQPPAANHTHPMPTEACAAQAQPTQKDSAVKPKMTPGERKVLIWDIVSIACGVFTFFLEVLVPFLGMFLALPFTLITLSVAGVAATICHEELHKRDVRALAVFIVISLLLVWCCIKIGTFIASVFTGVSVLGT